MFKGLVFTVAMGTLGAVAAAGSALAAPLTLVVGDSYTLNSPYSVPLNDTVTLNDSAVGVSNETGEAGQISSSWTNTTANNTGTVSVWCTDIQVYLSAPATYTLGLLSTTVTDPTKVAQINALLYNDLNPTTADASAALQAAIWDVEYSSGDTGYSINTGNLSISGLDSTAITDADADLNNVLAGTWKANSADTVYEFIPTTPGSNQTLTYLGPSSPQTTGSTGVPEPGSLALLATSLLGFAVVRRQYRRA